MPEDKSIISYDEWVAEGTRRFGKDMLDWRFVCPSCGHITSVRDWKDADAPEGAVAFSCVGRYLNADDENSFKNQGGPCQYAGGGLFKLNPVTVVRDGEASQLFAFAKEEKTC